MANADELRKMVIEAQNAIAASERLFMETIELAREAKDKRNRQWELVLNMLTEAYRRKATDIAVAGRPALRGRPVTVSAGIDGLKCQYRMADRFTITDVHVSWAELVEAPTGTLSGHPQTTPAEAPGEPQAPAAGPAAPLPPPDVP